MYKTELLIWTTTVVSYTEHWNNARKTKENDVKTILFSLAYLTLIKILCSMSTGIGLPSGQCYLPVLSVGVFVQPSTGMKSHKKKSQNWSETILQSSR